MSAQPQAHADKELHHFHKLAKPTCCSAETLLNQTQFTSVLTEVRVIRKLKNQSYSTFDYAHCKCNTIPMRYM